MLQVVLVRHSVRAGLLRDLIFIVYFDYVVTQIFIFPSFGNVNC